MSTKGIFRCIAALSGILLLAVPAAAQLENMEAEQEPSTDKRLASLIERLEIGMSALEELERRDAESERDAEGNIEDLNHRIEILRFALDAFTRAGHEESAHTMRRFLHVAELQREGADDRALAQAFEGLSMERTIELLQKASGIYAEWGVEERAETCNQLAEFYAAREHGRTTEDR